MIEASHIVFEYPGKRALKDVSFSIQPGSITALVGPNGAGKSTLMRCIAALDDPFSGDIVVDGLDAREHPRKIHARVGYLSDFFGLYNDLTVVQCLTYMARVRHVPDANVAAKVAETIELLGLGDYAYAKSGALSRGWRQRLGIAQAIIHEPKVLLLDEPASGLDPEARSGLSRLFLSLKAKGMTLVVSSHILSELEDYCTDMLLLRDGKVLDNLKSASGGAEQSTEHLVITLCDAAAAYLPVLEKLSICDIQPKENTVECTIIGGETERHALLKELIQQNVPVSGFSVKKRRLQDIYMEYAEPKGGKNDAP